MLYFFSRRSICYCLEGTPPELRDHDAAKQYSDNATLLNEFWQRPSEALFNSTDAVDVIVPRLLRRERIQIDPPPPPEKPKGPSLAQQLEEAKKKAAHAAMMAASLAARGGLLYSPPLGIDIQDFLEQNIKMQDQSKLEDAFERILQKRATFAAAGGVPATTMAPPATTAAAAPPAANTMPSIFIRGVGNGGSIDVAPAAPVHTGTQVPVDVPLLIPQQQQQQQQRSITPPTNNTNNNNINTSYPPDVSFPAEFRRGPRKRAPAKAWKLTLEHNTSNLTGKLIQILVESSREWHPALILMVNPVEGIALVVLESNIQQLLPLRRFIENEAVAWLNKETAQEYIGAGKSGGGSGGTTPLVTSGAGAAGASNGGSTGRKRGAGASGKPSVPSKYQMVSPITSSVGGDSIGIGGGGGGGVSGVGSGAGGFSGNAFAAPGGAAVGTGVYIPVGIAIKEPMVEEDEEDKEKKVLERLKSVTKRQRAVAAKKVSSTKTSPDSKISEPEADRAGTSTAAQAQGAVFQSFAQQQQQLQQQASVPLPPGFIPLDTDNGNLLPTRHDSLPATSAITYDSIGHQQQQYNRLQEQQKQKILSNLGASSSMVMPHIFQLGEGIMRGKQIRLTINSLVIDAVVYKIDPESQSMVVVVKGRPVVLKSQDEGVKFRLAFI